MSRVRRVVAGLALLGSLTLLALTAAADRLDEGTALLAVSTVAAVLAVAAMALQPWLATDRRRARIHVLLGATVLALVAVHVLALLVLSPDDALFAMSPAGPTRARMAVLSLVLLVAVGLLGALRRRLDWSGATWRLLHGGLAALAVALGVGHAVLTDGALDVVLPGLGTGVLVVLGLVGLAGVLAARAAGPVGAPGPPGPPVRPGRPPAPGRGPAAARASGRAGADAPPPPGPR